MDERERCNEEKEEETGETAINLSFSVIRHIVFHEIVTRNETKTCVLVKRKFIINKLINY